MKSVALSTWRRRRRSRIFTVAEFLVDLKPETEWKRGISKKALFDEMDAEPAQNHRTHAIGKMQCRNGRDTRAHRIADEIGLREMQMIEK